MTDLAEAPIETAPAPAPSGVGAALRLIAIVAVAVGLFVAFGLVDLLLVIVALVVMVTLHEFAHFITAKKSGMKVTEFFVGFGPRLWSVRRGETEYGFKAIPAGGYCRIVGMTSAEELHPDDEPRAYRNQAFPKRIVVASAGSAMHFLIAFVLAFLALTLIGRPDASVIKVDGFLTLDHGKATPAQIAGIRPGDQIIAVNGHRVTSDATLSSVVHHHVGAPVSITVERAGVTKTVRAVPLDGRTVSYQGGTLAPANGPPTGFIGVSLGQGTSTEGPLSAIGNSASIVRQATVATVTGIGHLFSPAGISSYAHQVVHPAATTAPAGSAAAQSQAASRPESIIGAVRTATQAAQAGTLTLIEVLISINIFVGILNMLPMLPLDGGHVAIAAYEWARTRRGRPMYRADVTKLMPVVYAFVGLLLILVTTSMYLDLTHPAANPFH
jgi:membrane-associated protease RseP (regulator of RpoE activity)